MAKKESNKPQYKKLSQLDHILLRSETYIGSKTSQEIEMFVVDDISLKKEIKVIKKKINYNPAFIKLFDEILVNASDQVIRTGKVKTIKINIDNNSISIENDGPSIPIELHKQEKVYNPELIFGHLLTGENYDDSEERVVGGRNGLGAKLANVFSTKFIVDCCDGKKKYKQIFQNNMKTIGKPTITTGTKSFTNITFFPDLERFGMNIINDDSKSIMLKRCLDIAVYNQKIKVIVNGITLPIKNAKDYMQMHLSEGSELFYEKLGNGWEVGITKTTSEQFEQVSIVNGINTYRGGTHVSYISNQTSKDIADSFAKKINASWVDVKNKIFLFLICQIPNPEFDTQTKENLTKYISKEIHCNSKVSDVVVKKIMKSEIVESILNAIEQKEKDALKKLQKQNQKTKIEKLIDANSNDRIKCSLAIFEGESAGSSSVVYRNPLYQGIYKLKGKFMNTTKMTDKRILQDEKGNRTEAANLMQAIGLELNKPVKKEDLRFGEIQIFSDADFDGDSICGLLINFFAKWPNLFHWGKIFRVNTPLLTIEKGKEKKYFYSQDEWEKYKTKYSLSGWNIEYKKGLGSLTNDEYKEIIQNPNKTQIIWDSKSQETLDCWFGEDAENRKQKLI